MAQVIEIYRDPLFVLFPIVSLLISAGAFLVFALALSWLFVRNPPRLRPYRLQDRPEHARAAVWPSLLRLAGNFAFMLTLSVVTWPVVRLSGVHAGDPPSWIAVLWQLPVFLVADDICFYFLHRVLHTRWLYRHVHKVHHRVTAPSALAGAYFHPIEYALINFAALAGPIIVGPHVVTLWIWVVLRQWLAAEGHCGFVLPWSPTHLLPGLEGAAYHDWHHRRFVGNYANFFGCLDGWFGTRSSDYTALRTVSPSPAGLPLSPRER